MLHNELFFDAETTSLCDLKLHGLGRYLRDPSTRVNSWAYRLPRTTETQLWVLGDPLPEDVATCIEAGVMVVAHNAGFDFNIWNEVFRRDHPHMPKLQRSQMRCSATRARYNGLPGALERACELMNLPIRKDVEGAKAMKVLMVNPDATPETHPNEFAIQSAYNITDVDAMIGLWEATQPLPAREQAFYELDMLINARGFGVDVQAAQAMAELAEYEQALIDYKVTVLTGGKVMAATEIEKIKDLASDMGAELTDAGRESLKTLLSDGSVIPAELREILNLRLDASRTPKKHQAILRAHVGRRMPHATVFHGALTGRDTAMGCGDVQLLNVARPRPGKSREDCEAYLTAVKRKDKAFLSQPDVGPALAAMADAQRQLFCATMEGHTLIAADLSGIEARMAPWLANDEQLLVAYEQGTDAYKLAACAIYGVEYDAVTKDQRQVGKVAQLALTYGGGAMAFTSMAANYGVHLPDDQVQDIVANWRTGRPAFERWWSMLEYAALMALDQPGRAVDVPIGRGFCAKVTFVRDDRALRMQLPSGRAISYHDAKLHMEPGATVPVAIYLKPEGYYERLDRKTLSNNLTQGLARDLFWEILIDAERVERIVHRVYDEVILEVPKERAQQRLDELLARMKITPGWAPGLPLGADGAISDSWGKD